MKYLNILWAMMLSASCLAEPIKDVQDTKKLCGSAAEAFGQGDAKGAFDILKVHWPLPKQEIDNLSYQTESQLKMAASRFGNTIGSDFISTKTAGNSFVQHTYIGKYEKHAVRYVCVFYKPKDHWVVNTVYWDDKTPLLFD